jgi:integrase-like protein
MSQVRVPSGHVFRVERQRGPVWYAKYRLPDGRQVQKKIGPAWTERGRPAEGYFTKRTAEAWLRDRLHAERRGAVTRTRVTFAEAVEEWLRYVEQDRDCKPSTLVDYRSVVRRLLPEFGELRLDQITPERSRHGVQASVLTATARCPTARATSR